MTLTTTELNKIQIILDRYHIYPDGTCENKIRGTKTKGTLQAHGYYTLSVRYQGKLLRVYMHRLVAHVYVPNPSNLPFVNHKDSNKQNNNADNLEWCTCKQNNQHAITSMLNPQQKQVKCIETGGLYPSASTAARALGFKSHSSITNVCTGKAKTAGGYHWEYINRG